MWLRPTSSTLCAPRSASAAGAGRPAPRRPRRRRVARSVRRTGIDPGAVDDVIFGCVDTIGAQAGNIARTVVAGRRPARGGARRHRRPAVRVAPAGHPLRRPGGDGRHRRPRRRRRRAEHERDPDQLRHDRRRAFGFTDPFPGSKAGCSATATRRSRQFRSAEMIAEKWDISREEMEAVRARASHQRALRRPSGGPLRERDRAARRLQHRRGPARARRWRRCRSLQTLARAAG